MTEPREPTEAMLEAGLDALLDGDFDLRSPFGRRAAVAAIWRAMAAAAISAAAETLRGTAAGMRSNQR
jgi:hypothetical protein